MKRTTVLATSAALLAGLAHGELLSCKDIQPPGIGSVIRGDACITCDDVDFDACSFDYYGILADCPKCQNIAEPDLCTEVGGDTLQSACANSAIRSCSMCESVSTVKGCGALDNVVNNFAQLSAAQKEEMKLGFCAKDPYGILYQCPKCQKVNHCERLGIIATQKSLEYTCFNSSVAGDMFKQCKACGGNQPGDLKLDKLAADEWGIGFGVLPGVGEKICDSSSDVTSNCAVDNDINFELKAPVIGGGSLVSASVNMDVCPGAAGDFNPQLSLVLNSIRITPTSTTLTTTVTQQKEVNIFDDMGPSVIEMGFINDPWGIGSLSATMVVNIDSTTSGFATTLSGDVCLEFDALVMRLLSKATLSEKAKALIDSLYSNKFCSTEMKEKLIAFYEQFRDFDNAADAVLADAVAEAVASVGPFVKDLEATTFPIIFYKNDIQIADFCKPRSIETYSEQATLRGVKAPEINNGETNDALRMTPVGYGAVLAASLWFIM